MNGPIWQRSGRLRISSLVGGSILAMTMVVSGVHAPQQVSAAPALFCAPVNPSFGVFADEPGAPPLDLPRPDFGCQLSAASANTGASSGQTNQMASPAVAQQSVSAEEDAWLAAYLAQSYDRVR